MAHSVDTPAEPARTAHVSRVLDMITAQSGEQFDKNLLASMVTEAAARYDGARVQDFVPVLVFREVRDQLRHLGS